MVTFELEGEAYWPIREEGLSLSDEAKEAIGSAEGVTETTRRRVTWARKPQRVPRPPKLSPTRCDRCLPRENVAVLFSRTFDKSCQ